MFNDATARGAIATAQDELVELRTLVTSATEQLAALASQVTAMTDKVARLYQLGGEQDEAAARQEETLNRHAGQLSGLGGDLRDQEERSKRLGADVGRLKRQATIDLEEMRRNYAAVAEAIVQSRIAATRDRGDDLQQDTSAHR